jgi:hypothetical protein
MRVPDEDDELDSDVDTEVVGDKEASEVKLGLEASVGVSVADAVLVVEMVADAVPVEVEVVDTVGVAETDARRVEVEVEVVDTVGVRVADAVLVVEMVADAVPVEVEVVDTVGVRVADAVLVVEMVADAVPVEVVDTVRDTLTVAVEVDVDPATNDGDTVGVNEKLVLGVGDLVMDFEAVIDVVTEIELDTVGDNGDLMRKHAQHAQLKG